MIKFKDIIKVWGLSVLAFTPCIQSFSQDTGPGGVGTSSNNVIWLDANQLGLSDGAAVSTWTDASGNGNDFTQATPADQPMFNTSGSINSMPTVTFDGASEFLGSGAITDLDTDELSYFIILQNQSSLPTPTDEKYGMVISTRSSENNIEWAVQLKRENGSVVAVERYARTSGGPFAISTTLRNNTEALASTIIDGIWRGDNNIYGLVDGGGSASTAGANNTGFTHVLTNIGAGLDGADASVRWFEGEIAEVIVFSEEINSAQEKIINNYLSAKYDITLTANAIFAFNSTHGNDVAGIGRDDASNQHLSALGSGIVSMTVGSLDDADYLIWGHDGAGFGVTNSDIPTAYSGTNGNRLEQEWVVSEAGDLSDNTDITMTFNIGGNEFGVDDEYQLLINQNGDADWTDADTIPGSYAGGIVTITVPAGDLIDGSLFTLGHKQKTIISVVDGQNWNVTSTWSCLCIPNNGSNAIIDDAHTVTVSDAQSINNLTVEGTGTLVVDNGADLEITGDVDSDGTFTVNSASKITLNGSSLQTLDFVGTVAFDSLEVDNSSNISLSTGTFTFGGALLPLDGDIDFNGNSVTFLSSAGSTAAIGPMGVSVDFNNFTNVTSQRSIEGGVAGWSEVGFPFSASYKLDDWDDDVFMSGPDASFDNGCAASSAGCFASVKYWDPTSAKMFGIHDADSVINAGRGVDIFLGDNLNTFSGALLEVSGKSLNLSQSVIVSVDAGWNFIANPFLCPVNWNNVALGAGVDNYFWVYDAESGWLFYEPGGAPETNSANLAGGIISSYQGIWVFNSGGASTVTFNQGSKSVSSSDAFVKSAEIYDNNEFFSVVLESEEVGVAASRLYVDITGLGKKTIYPKLPTTHNNHNLYAIEENEAYSFITFGGTDDCRKVELGVDGITSGEYTMDFENVPFDETVYLIDDSQGRVIEIESGESLSFYLTETDRNRFSLLFSKAGFDCQEDMSDITVLLTPMELGFQLTLDRPVGNYRVQLVDMLGQVVYQSSNIANEQMRTEHNGNFNSGSYIVNVIDMNGASISTEKFIFVR